MMNFIRDFFLITFISFTVIANGQTPGVIVQKATGVGAAVLDPNNDGYVSSTTTGFTTNDKTQSEINYRPIPMPGIEPNSDLGPGPDCRYTDFVDSGVEDPALLAYDGSNMLIRLRLGGLAPNSKGYSIFIDTDEKLGFTGPNADPNAITGNPGFEIEVSCQTNFGIYLYNVDGTISPTEEASLSGTDYYQKSVALSTDCGDADYFYDFYIPFSLITTHFPSVTTSTKLRMAIMTSMSPAAALGSNSQSDLTGINDATYNYNYDQMFISVIENFYPSTVIELGASTPLDRSACPAISTSISTSTSSISGTSVEADNTTIKVYKNGSLLGTTTVASNAWTLNGVSGLSANDIITATATAPNKTESIANCSSKTVAACANITTAIVSGDVSIIGGNKGFDIVVARPIGSIIKCYYSNYTLIDPVALALEAPYDLNTVTTTTNPQTVKFKCQTGNCFGTGVYYFSIQEPSKCVSDYYTACNYATGGTSTTPAITTPTTLTTTTTSISGTSAASATIYAYSGGVLIGSTTANGAGSWTLNSLSFAAGQVVTAIAHETGKCTSTASTSKTVSYKTNTPVIVGSYCTSSTVTSISGYVSETSGTVQIYKNAVAHGAAATISSTGAWTATGLTLVATDVVTAIATVASSTASEISLSITIEGKSTNAVAISGTITEGATSVSGTGTNGDVIRVYADDVQVGTTATVAAGVWTISDIGVSDLYAGATLTAKATTGASCLSDASVSKTVQCIAPSTSLNITESTDTIYAGNTVGVTVHSSETQTLYQLMVGGIETGTTKLGTGGDITLTTGALSEDVTLAVKTIKVVPTACTNNLVETANVKVIANPLPVDLLSFSAKCNFDKVDISWVTANEQNNDFFTLEKSDNSWTFNELKKIQGAGNSNSIISYSAEDNNPFNLTYYRIIQTDFDGKFTTFDPVSITCDLKNEFKIENLHLIYTALSFNVVLKGMDSQLFRINLFDVNGRNVYSNIEFIEESSVKQILIDLKAFSPGVYIVSVDNSDEAITKKFKLIK